MTSPDAAPSSDVSRAGGAPPQPDEPGTPRRSHAARNAAIAVGVVLVLLIVVLATRKPAEERFGANPIVGRAVPQVAGTTLDGKPFDIDKLRGKWVVVNFFSTWCVPCRQEHPELVRFAEEHAAAGDAEVVSVVFDDQADAVRSFFAERGGTWPVLGGETGPIALGFGVTGVPESYVVSPQGQVVAKFNGVTRDDLDAVIAQATAPSPAGAGTMGAGS